MVSSRCDECHKLESDVGCYDCKNCLCSACDDKIHSFKATSEHSREYILDFIEHMAEKVSTERDEEPSPPKPRPPFANSDIAQPPAAVPRSDPSLQPHSLAAKPIPDYAPSPAAKPLPHSDPSPPPVQLQSVATSIPCSDPECIPQPSPQPALPPVVEPTPSPRSDPAQVTQPVAEPMQQMPHPSVQPPSQSMPQPLPTSSDAAFATTATVNDTDNAAIEKPVVATSGSQATATSGSQATAKAAPAASIRKSTLRPPHRR